MATIPGDLKTKFTNDVGEPLVGGQVYTYYAGTSTPKDSYQDKAFTVVNTNPIILDDAGSCDLYLKGLYRIRVLDSEGVFVEERDYMTQGDSTGSSIVDNANNINILQTEVQAINERSVLKLDELNFIIGHGQADSATVYDPAFRADKIKVSIEGDTDSPKNMFKTYTESAEVNGNTVEPGAYLNPDLVMPLLGTAATKNIGDGKDDVAVNKSLFKRSMSHDNMSHTFISGPIDLSSLEFGDIAFGSASQVSLPNYAVGYTVYNLVSHQTINYPWQIAFGHRANEILIRHTAHSKYTWDRLYSTSNTTLDGGYLKPSSPVLRLSHDDFVKEHEAEQLDIKVENPEKGVYKITGTTGLRKNDGWYFSPPKDEHLNVLCMVVLEEVDDIITVKTYAKKFDFNTVSIVPDYDNPVDIPSGGEVLLRFNDLPSDETDELSDSTTP